LVVNCAPYPIEVVVEFKEACSTTIEWCIFAEAESFGNPITESGKGN
jgi:hypothetical protein